LRGEADMRARSKKRQQPANGSMMSPLSKAAALMVAGTAMTVLAVRARFFSDRCSLQGVNVGP
jgi:hypothetical protein